MVYQEFQAVILAAGRGTRLPEITGDSPKCLLPVGPFPLLWYPLNMLQRHNFQGILQNSLTINNKNITTFNQMQ